MEVSVWGLEPSTPRALLVVLVTLLLCLYLSRWLWPSGGLSLPGPFQWPLIGNAAQLGNAPHLYFSRLASRYGPVFQIRLGCRSVVVLNGAAIRQALVRQGPEFAGRPDFTSFQYVAGGNSIAFGTTSDWWRAQRRAAHSTVRMFSTGNVHTKWTFEQHVLGEVRQVLRVFVQRTREQHYFPPMTDLVVSTANIMAAVCFGKRYSYDDDEFRQVVGRNDQFTRTVGAGSIVDVMPWLQFFPNPIKTIFDNFKRLNAEFFSFIMDKVLEHRKSLQSTAIRDVTDALIMALEKMTELSPPQPASDLVASAVGDIFGASQDTLSTALQWIILILVKYPEMQQRLQQEVDRVVDRTRLPTLEDQSRLPYVMAFIYEVMRFTSFVPLTIPHSTTADTSINGYSIPKNTVVFINQWSVNHDPDIWARPQTFWPERFLDADGGLNKDLMGSVLIFSLGKRRCIGEELSKLHLFLFIAILAHQCHISPEPGRPLSLDFVYGLTLKPHDYSIAVSLRDDWTLLDAAIGSSGGSEEQKEPKSD